MAYQRVQKFSPWNSQPQKKTSQFGPRPFPVQDQESDSPPTPQDLEDAAFDQHKFEATGLEVKEEYGTITPQEKEKLGVLRAKMNDFWVQRMERTKGQPNLLEILMKNGRGIPTTEPPAPIQAKLTIGEPGDKYEQEADQVAAKVVNQINTPQTQQSLGGQTGQLAENDLERSGEERRSLRLGDSQFNQHYPELQRAINVSLGRVNPDLLMRKIETKIDGKGGKKYFAEAALEGSKKHGIQWKANEAYARAKSDGLPQGKFGTKADVEAAVFAAAKYLALGEQGTFNLPGGHNCIVYPVPTNAVPKPPTLAATHMYVKVYENGKVHAYPYDNASYTPASVTSYTADYSDQATYI